MPGDALEIRILSVTPRIPYGTVSTRPGRGGIPDDVKAALSPRSCDWTWLAKWAFSSRASRCRWARSWA